MKGVEAVLFDFDGTLVDSLAVEVVASRRVAGEIVGDLQLANPRAATRRLVALVREVGEEMEGSLVFDRDVWWVEVLRRMNVGVAVSSEVLRRWTERYWEEFAKGKPFPDTVETLEALRRYALGIVTNTDGTPGAKRRRIRLSGLDHYFSAVVVGGEDGVKLKPDPHPFLTAASELSLLAERCLVVGDKPFSDVRGAKRAGMSVALVLRRDWPGLENPDCIIHSLSELLSVLRSTD